MKDTILNSFVILAAVSAFAYHLVGDLAPAVQEAVQQASVVAGDLSCSGRYLELCHHLGSRSFDSRSTDNRRYRNHRHFRQRLSHAGDGEHRVD